MNEAQKLFIEHQYQLLKDIHDLRKSLLLRNCPMTVIFELDDLIELYLQIIDKARRSDIFMNEYFKITLIGLDRLSLNLRRKIQEEIRK